MHQRLILSLSTILFSVGVNALPTYDPLAAAAGQPG